MAPDSPPIVVGATGGSGTRAVHAMLARAGVHMGVNLNHAGDAMDFEPFLDDAINPVLRAVRGLDYEPTSVPAGLRRPLLDRLSRIIAAYRAEVPAGAPRWGWKNPRSMYILPLIVALQPQLTFVHVVRDGRDMALSDNQNQLNKHFADLFGRPPSEPLLADSIRLWARANLDTARWASRRLGDRYIRVRLEDLCANPMSALQDLCARLGVTADLSAMAATIKGPDSLGRWREMPSEHVGRMAQAGADGLAAFGYV